jgi:poly(3-hydroxybutyrate) depolymerase
MLLMLRSSRHPRRACFSALLFTALLSIPWLEACSAARSIPQGPAEAPAPAPGSGEAATTFSPVVTPVGSSKGCGNRSAPAGELSLSLGGKPREYLLTLPSSYDSTVPQPLIFAFHGFGRSHLSMAESDSGGFQHALAEHALLVFPKSQGEGWDFPHELAASLEFFEALYAHVVDNYCVDRTRILALGHSSGGYFANMLGCRHAELLRGLVLVAGALEHQVDCQSPLPALIIHGVRDVEVPISRGWSARDHYRQRSGCSLESLPVSESPCVEYQGCLPSAPVVWCPHEEATYRDTNHGWPSFANRAIERFLGAVADPPPDTAHNLLQNSRFESNEAGPWQLFFLPPARGKAVHGGSACVHIEDPGVNAWDVQIAHRPVAFEPGHRYVLDFRAWASAPTVVRPKLGKEVAPYDEYWANRFPVGPSPRRIRAEFVMGSPADKQGELAFHLGGAYAGRAPVEVCVDDVYLSDPAYEAGASVK